MKIAVFYDPPPIPCRNSDYTAYDVDNYEPGMPLGRGPTPEAALAELKEQFEERSRPLCSQDVLETAIAQATIV